MVPATEAAWHNEFDLSGLPVRLDAVGAAARRPPPTPSWAAATSRELVNWSALHDDPLCARPVVLTGHIEARDAHARTNLLQPPAGASRSSSSAATRVAGTSGGSAEPPPVDG